MTDQQLESQNWFAGQLEVAVGPEGSGDVSVQGEAKMRSWISNSRGVVVTPGVSIAVRLIMSGGGRTVLRMNRSLAHGS